MDLQAQFRSAYQLIALVGDDITLMYRTAVGYDSVGPIKAKVAELRMNEIVAGSSARIGDLRAIVLAASIPAGQRRLELKDRVLWRGRQYAVVQYDDATASIGSEVLAVNIYLRG